MEVHQELADPATLGHRMSDGPVLSLSTGERDCSLSLGRPRNKVVTKVYVVFGGRMARVWTTHLVSVRVSCQGGYRRDMKLKTWSRVPLT